VSALFRSRAVIEPTDHIGVLYLRFFIPMAGSLKAKRSVIKSLKDRVRNRYNVSVSEIGDLDKWQSSVIGICAISSDKIYLDQQFQDLITFVTGEGGGADLLEHQIQFS